MKKNLWQDLTTKGPIAALAPMDGYTDSPYRQIVKKIAPNTVVFSEFFSADGLTHSKRLQETALKHSKIESPLIIQIFGKDPIKFAEAAKIIEDSGVDGIDINMGCPARKVVKSGHGSSLMIQRETAFKIVEEMVKAVDIPVSVKTRLGWDNDEPLIDFCKGLENAGASLITVHGRTYKQAFGGEADFTGIYKLKQALKIPVIGNGDVSDYDDGMQKILSPNPDDKPLDGFMIGRASFGNPWCFLPGKYIPTLAEVLDTMTTHGELLWKWKERRGMMEARKHLVQYLRNFPGVKSYRSQLVHVESPDDILNVIGQIRNEHAGDLQRKIDSF
ncbi:dihydrouridine synthase [Candidatus Gracilibacteria bacterium]|nr:MAG: dihydrouridine synthase [Candidatus Gracilibacteria bacterium]